MERIMDTAEKPEWQPLRFHPNELKRTTEIKGQKVEVMMSPYDVPEAMRAYRLPSQGWVAIEFRYLVNDEGLKTVKIREDLLYQVGIASSRLYAIHFNLNSALVNRSNQKARLKWAEVDRAMKRIIDDNKDRKKLSSYNLAKRALFNAREDIVPT
jgi:hypothetical protein